MYVLELVYITIVVLCILTMCCMFYFVGSHFFKQKRVQSNVQFFEEFEDLKLYLCETNISNTSILIKGSRRMALERILELI